MKFKVTTLVDNTVSISGKELILVFTRAVEYMTAKIEGL